MNVTSAEPEKKRPAQIEDEDFDAYHKWLGIPKDKRPPTHYQLLGISSDEEDQEAITAASERQLAFVKQFRMGEQYAHANSIIHEIEEAKLTLLNPQSRRMYDATLHLAHRRQRRNARGLVEATVSNPRKGE